MGSKECFELGTDDKQSRNSRENVVGTLLERSQPNSATSIVRLPESNARDFHGRQAKLTRAHRHNRMFAVTKKKIDLPCTFAQIGRANIGPPSI